MTQSRPLLPDAEIGVFALSHAHENNEPKYSVKRFSLTISKKEVTRIAMDKRPRKVYGRRRVKKDGSTFVVELRKDGVHLRELYSRREYSARLGEVVDLLMGQQIIRIAK